MGRFILKNPYSTQWLYGKHSSRLCLDEYSSLLTLPSANNGYLLQYYVHMKILENCYQRVLSEFKIMFSIIKVFSGYIIFMTCTLTDPLYAFRFFVCQTFIQNPVERNIQKLRLRDMPDIRWSNCALIN